MRPCVCGTATSEALSCREEDAVNRNFVLTGDREGPATRGRLHRRRPGLRQSSVPPRRREQTPAIDQALGDAVLTRLTHVSATTGADESLEDFAFPGIDLIFRMPLHAEAKPIVGGLDSLNDAVRRDGVDDDAGRGVLGRLMVGAVTSNSSISTMLCSNVFCSMRTCDPVRSVDWAVRGAGHPRLRLGCAG